MCIFSCTGLASLTAVLFKGQPNQRLSQNSEILRRGSCVFTAYSRLLGTIIIFEWGSHMKQLYLKLEPIAMFWKNSSTGRATETENRRVCQQSLKDNLYLFQGKCQTKSGLSLVQQVPLPLTPCLSFSHLLSNEFKSLDSGKLYLRPLLKNLQTVSLNVF